MQITDTELEELEEKANKHPASWYVLDLIAELRQIRAERDWLANNLANALIGVDLVEHLAELGGMSPPDPATLIEAAREATCQTKNL